MSKLLVSTSSSLAIVVRCVVIDFDCFDAIAFVIVLIAIFSCN